MNLSLLLLQTRFEAALALICKLSMDWREGHQGNVSNVPPGERHCVTLSLYFSAQNRRARHQLPWDTLSTSQQPSRFISTGIGLLNMLSVFYQPLSLIDPCLVFLHNCHPNLLQYPPPLKDKKRRERGKGQSPSTLFSGPLITGLSSKLP